MKVILALLFACVAVASANYGYSHQPHYVQPTHHQTHAYAAHAPKGKFLSLRAVLRTDLI